MSSAPKQGNSAGRRGIEELADGGFSGGVPATRSGEKLFRGVPATISGEKLFRIVILFVDLQGVLIT